MASYADDRIGFDHPDYDRSLRDRGGRHRRVESQITAGMDACGSAAWAVAAAAIACSSPAELGQSVVPGLQRRRIPPRL